ncbi:MAG: hypothetical protein DWH97_11270 [Planctomycetota bacterium]|nr:MAG: hypothetical protein DWH97_11270 [Planctomycetota bacterium]RLS91818.1 MAG: hypothetical protein DWI12_12580 [Planctomycetota bacterium]
MSRTTTRSRACYRRQCDTTSSALPVIDRRIIESHEISASFRPTCRSHPCDGVIIDDLVTTDLRVFSSAL